MFQMEGWTHRAQEMGGFVLEHCPTYTELKLLNGRGRVMIINSPNIYLGSTLAREFAYDKLPTGMSFSRICRRKA